MLFKQSVSTPVDNCWHAQLGRAKICRIQLIESGLIGRYGVEIAMNSCEEFSPRILDILYGWAQVWQFD